MINALSGVSGAGRSKAVELSFTEVNENIRAYKVGTHQHIPEIQTVLAAACGQEVSLFVHPASGAADPGHLHHDPCGSGRGAFSGIRP